MNRTDLHNGLKVKQLMHRNTNRTISKTLNSAINNKIKTSSITKVSAKIASLLLAASLFACNQLPSNVIISPELLPTNVQSYQHKTANLAVLDRRNNVHVLQIMKDNKAVTLLNSQMPLTEIIKTELIQSYAKSSLLIKSTLSPLHIDVYLDDALINVNQELFEYNSNNMIKVHVQVSNGEQKLSKSFSHKASSSGPTRADLAVLERDFSQQLGKVIQSILLDAELQEFIRSQ